MWRQAGGGIGRPIRASHMPGITSADVYRCRLVVIGQVPAVQEHVLPEHGLCALYCMLLVSLWNFYGACTIHRWLLGLGSSSSTAFAIKAGARTQMPKFTGFRLPERAQKGRHCRLYGMFGLPLDVELSARAALMGVATVALVTGITTACLVTVQRRTPNKKSGKPAPLIPSIAELSNWVADTEAQEVDETPPRGDLALEQLTFDHVRLLKVSDHLFDQLEGQTSPELSTSSSLPLLPAPASECAAPEHSSQSIVALKQQIPSEAHRAWAVASTRLHSEAERVFLSTLLSFLASSVTDDVPAFWSRKEALLVVLVRLGADAAMMSAALLYDTEATIEVPWQEVRSRVAVQGEIGQLVARLVDEKRDFGQMSSLFYLRALQTAPSTQKSWRAVTQLVRQLSVQGVEDYCAVLLELTVVAVTLAEMSTEADLVQLRRSSASARALARTALDLHAPLSHAFGFDALLEDSATGLLPLPNCWTLTQALEHLSLWNLYPSEYGVVVDWFDREFGLLERTLAQGSDVVHAALSSCRRFGALTLGYELTCRVKSPQSLMKKMLQGRHVNDLLGMQVVIFPISAEVSMTRALSAGQEGAGLGLTVGEASCFAAVAAIQRFASRADVGWVLAPGSLKDYVKNPKQSGYQAIHLALVTDIFASQMRPAAGDHAQTDTSTALVTRAPCQLEMHIFTEEMKLNERSGMASHSSYKAFPMRPHAILENLEDGGAAVSMDQVAQTMFPSTVRAEGVLSTLAERAGFDGADALTLEDLERSRAEVDAVVGMLQSPKLVQQVAQTHNLLALPAPREGSESRDGETSSHALESDPCESVL